MANEEMVAEREVAMPEKRRTKGREKMREETGRYITPARCSNHKSDGDEARQSWSGERRRRRLMAMATGWRRRNSGRRLPESGFLALAKPAEAAVPTEQVVTLEYQRKVAKVRHHPDATIRREAVELRRTQGLCFRVDPPGYRVDLIEPAQGAKGHPAGQRRGRRRGRR